MGVLNVQQATRQNGSVQGLAVQPYNIEIICNGSVIGMVQSINPAETRNVNKIQAIGVEGVVTSVPGNYTGGTFSTPMIEIYDQAAMEAWGIVDEGGRVRGGLRALPRVISLKQQRRPVDINIITYTPVEGAEYIETYLNCWITSYGRTIQVGNNTIGINVSWTYDDVI